MNWYRIGSYIWTVCGASWIFIALLMDIPLALLAGLLCLVLSAFWSAHS